MKETKNEKASNALYVVRLRSAFRFAYPKDGDYRRIHINQMPGAFSTRQAAQLFVQTKAPTNVNPFAVTWGLSVENDAFIMWHDEVEDDGFDDDGYIWQSAGMFDSDDGPVEGGFQVRADETETSFKGFADLCSQIGVTPPNLPSFSPLILWNKEQERRKYVEELLPQWWEETKNSMTNTQKAAIWRKLHPRPYEIVPVPLEKEG